MEPRHRRTACLFWALALGSFIFTAMYLSLCIVNLECDKNLCPYIEGLTVITVLGFVCTAFWHCYKQKARHPDDPNIILQPLPIFMENSSRRAIASGGSGQPLLENPLNLTAGLEKVGEDLIPEDFECAICNDHEQGSDVLQLSCEHLFHKQCILKWFMSNSHYTCPICRTSQVVKGTKLVVITIIPQEGGRPVRLTQL